MQIFSIRELLEEHKKPMLQFLTLPPSRQAKRTADRRAAERGELFGG